MGLIDKAYTFLNVKIDDLIEKSRKETLAPERRTVSIDPEFPDGTASGYREKYSHITYDTLLRVSRKNSIIAAIIQTRLNQIASFSRPQKNKYSLGFKVRLKDLKKEPTKQEEKEIQYLEEFILNTGVIDDNRTKEIRENFETFVRKIVRDRLVVDQVAVEIIPTKNGSIHHFVPVSAGTIKFTSDHFKQMVQEGNFHRLDTKIGDGHVKQKLEQKEEYKYAQVYRDRVIDVFTEDDLIFRMANPTNDLDSNGYSIGELELLIQVITSHLHAENYNKLAFTHGHAGKGILHIKGQIPPAQLEAFKRNWYNQFSGNQNSWRSPVLAGTEDVKWINMQATNREMEYSQYIEYLIKLMCAIYQIDPMEINFDIARGGSTMGGASHRNEERTQISQDKGLRPILRFIENLINDEILSRLSDKYFFEFVGLNAETAEQELERQLKEAKTFKTINEIRRENDLDDLTMESLKESPGNWILDPTFSSIVMSFNGLTTEQQEGEAGGEEFGQGEDGEEDVDIDQLLADESEDEIEEVETEKSDLDESPLTKAKRYEIIKI